MLWLKKGNIFQVNVHTQNWRFLLDHVETAETADRRNAFDLEFTCQSDKLLKKQKQKKNTANSYLSCKFAVCCLFW